MKRIAAWFDRATFLNRMKLKLLTITLVTLVSLAACKTPSTAPAPDRTSASSQAPQQATCTAAGNAIWTGVKLYHDAACSQLFATILGGSKNVIGPDGQPVQGVKLQLASGQIDWKTRESVEALAYVKTDDPAIARREWQEFEDTSR